MTVFVLTALMKGYAKRGNLKAVIEVYAAACRATRSCRSR